MISTVTTSTVSTVTTAALAGSIALIGIIVLLILLIEKELFGAAVGNRFVAVKKYLNIGIIPLMIAFVLVTIFKVVEFLR